MIEIISKSVFDSNCDLLVNTINCRGVMGAGIALEFSLRYPEMYESYKRDCATGSIRVGETKIYECNGQKILNFPTKDDPYKKSDINFIVLGLEFFVKNYSATPLKYINDLKLNYAKELLRSSYYTVSEVAEKCGFENVYYFSLFMKKRTGKSPSQFLL